MMMLVETFFAKPGTRNLRPVPKAPLRGNSRQLYVFAVPADLNNTVSLSSPIIRRSGCPLYSSRHPQPQRCCGVPLPSLTLGARKKNSYEYCNIRSALRLTDSGTNQGTIEPVNQRTCEPANLKLIQQLPAIIRNPLSATRIQPQHLTPPPLHIPFIMSD